MTLPMAFTAKAESSAVVEEFDEAFTLFLIGLTIGFFGMALADATAGRDSEPLAPADPSCALEASNLHPVHRERAL